MLPTKTSSAESDNDTLSVIIRFHDPNRLALFEDAVFSLAIQFWRDIEVVVVVQNGVEALEEKLAEIIKAQPWIDLPQFQVFSVQFPDGFDGRSDLLNNGIAKAKGRYLAFLDDDDFVYQHGYTRLIETLKKEQAVVLAAGGCRVAKNRLSNGHWYIYGKDSPFRWGKNRSDLLFANFIPIHSYVIDRFRLAPEDIWFDVQSPPLEDYDFLLRLAVKYDFDFSNLDNPVCEYRYHDANSLNDQYGTPIQSPKIQRASERIEARKDSLKVTLSVRELLQIRSNQLPVLPESTDQNVATLMNSILNPLNYPNILSAPNRVTSSTWHEHIPFAMFLVAILRPTTFVELGTYKGDSYCAFCQAVSELELMTKCYAVDVWSGDEHGGYYGEEILAELRGYHDHMYGGFSRLIQSTFAEALRHFEDSSIDLLHIDGFHTYEAVKSDFESWLPKMSRRGVVLFHDTNVRERDFGVFQFWSEISAQYPHFEFTHGHGLGVLGVGKDQCEAMRALLNCNDKTAAAIRQLFFRLGHEVALHAQQKFYSNNRALLVEQMPQHDTKSASQSQLLSEKDEQLRLLSEQLALQWENTKKIQESLGWRLLQFMWRVKARLKS